MHPLSQTQPVLTHSAAGRAAQLSTVLEWPWMRHYCACAHLWLCSVLRIRQLGMQLGHCGLGECKAYDPAPLGPRSTRCRTLCPAHHGIVSYLRSYSKDPYHMVSLLCTRDTRQTRQPVTGSQGFPPAALDKSRDTLSLTVVGSGCPDLRSSLRL